MTLEILVDIYSDEIAVLSEIQSANEEIEVEYASGLSGLEIVGTLIVPSLALLLQTISFIKDLKKKKHESLTIKKMVIHYGPKIIVLPPDATPEQIAETIKMLDE